MDSILILIQTQLSDTVQIRSRHRHYSDTHLVLAYRYNPAIIFGWHLQAHLQQRSLTSPNGIFKPIPYTINYHILECKFLGTLVSNHLPPSSHEWRIRQSNSSGLRRLSRGNCVLQNLPSHFLKGHPGPSGLPPSNFKP